MYLRCCRNKFLFKKKKDNKRSNGGGGGGGGGGVKRGHVEIGDVKIVAQPIATSEPEVTDDVVYGKAKYKAPRYQRRPYQPTRQVREKVKNEAQKKSEFLKSLQELEKIPVRPRKKKIDADLRGGRDGGGLAGVGPATSGDEVDGKIHFNVEENFRRGRGDLLHQDLELIEQKLFRVGYFITSFRIPSAAIPYKSQIESTLMHSDVIGLGLPHHTSAISMATLCF